MVRKQVKEEFDESESDSIYEDDTREDLIDGDALNIEEEAFMKGYDEANDETESETEELDEDEDI